MLYVSYRARVLVGRSSSPAWLTRCLADSPTHRLTDSPTHRLACSLDAQVKKVIAAMTVRLERNCLGLSLPARSLAPHSCSLWSCRLGRTYPLSFLILSTACKRKTRSLKSWCTCI